MLPIDVAAKLGGVIGHQLHTRTCRRKAGHVGSSGFVLSVPAGQELTEKSPQLDAIKVDTAAHETLLTAQAGMKLTLSNQVCIFRASA